MWRALSFHPKTETIWMEDGEGNSSQWAELQAVGLIITHEPSSIVVHTDSWAVFTLCLPAWYHANWMVGHWPLWGQVLWQDLWASGQTKTVTVYDVTDHLPLASPGNNEADTLAQMCWLEGKPASAVAQWL